MGSARAAAAALAACVLASCAASGATTGRDAATTGSDSRASSGRAPGPGAPTVRERLVDNARWVERDGERALQVTPSTRLRESTDVDEFEEAWRRVVRAIPRADTPGMRDQFVCHAAFASDKEAWYLEPKRPAVGYWRTVRAGCNPGDVRDVG